MRSLRNFHCWFLLLYSLLLSQSGSVSDQVISKFSIILFDRFGWNLVFIEEFPESYWSEWHACTALMQWKYISNIYSTENYNTKYSFRLIVGLGYIIDILKTNVGFLSHTDVYSVITYLWSLAICLTVSIILELGACHKIPPPSKHTPPNHIHSPMCPHGILPPFLLPTKPGPPLSC